MFDFIGHICLLLVLSPITKRKRRCTHSRKDITFLINSLHQLQLTYTFTNLIYTLYQVTLVDRALLRSHKSSLDGSFLLVKSKLFQNGLLSVLISRKKPYSLLL